MSKKKINEDSMLSELSASSFFRPSEAEEEESTAQQSDDFAAAESVDTVVDTSVDSQAGQPVDQSTDGQNAKSRFQERRPLREQLERARADIGSRRRQKKHQNQRFDNSPILSRPKSFYITKQQDGDIDDIAERIEELLEGKIAHKIDRSVVVRLILESRDWTSDDAIDALAKYLVSKLVSQLVD